MRILMYHEVVDGKPTEEHAVSARSFSAQMAWLHKAGCSVVSLEDWLAAPEGRPRIRGAVAITFDDGYEDTYTTAWPILQRHGFPATVFLVTGSVGSTSRWRDGELGQAPLLSWAQVREMARSGVTFGAHTHSHRDLTSLGIKAASRELCESRDKIEQALTRPVVSLAYPYSQLDARIKELAAQCGYQLGCTYRPRYVGLAGRDPLELNRIGILAIDTLEDFRAKVRGTLRRRVAWYGRLLHARRRALVFGKDSRA